MFFFYCTSEAEFPSKGSLVFHSLIRTIKNICKHLFYLFIFLFFGCVGSSFLCEGFLQLWRAGATLHRGARASHCCGLSLRSTAPDAQAQ